MTARRDGSVDIYGTTAGAYVKELIASRGFKKPLSQKWMIKSLAAMTAQFLEGGIPAAALPLNASAFSER